MTGNIILIGFMGVGKGRTARALGAETERFAIDTDDLIESYTKMKIRKIFKLRGEPAFREIEQQTANWIETNVRNTVISTGGGFFMVNNIHSLGKVIYLHSSVEGIIAAMQQHPNSAKKFKKRPLLQDLEQAKLLYAKRLPLYQQAAHHHINVEGKEIIEVAQEISRLL